jgi:alpha-mannosidase
MGRHTISYAMQVHDKAFQQANVIQHAYELNVPLHLYQLPSEQSLLLGVTGKYSFFSLSKPNIILEAVKV